MPSVSSWVWTKLRAAAPSTGMSAHWASEATASDWTNESAILNGRRIYSFRGGASANLDYYDIPSNAWTAAAITYSPATETFTTGSKWALNGNFIYGQKDATGRWFRFDYTTNQQDGWSTMLYPQGAAVLGNTCFDVTYFDGATRVDFIYMVLNTSAVMLRQMVI